MEIQVKIKYFYKLILDLLIQGYYEEGLLKLNSLVGILKTEVYKQVHKSSKGSRIRFLGGTNSIPMVDWIPMFFVDQLNQHSW